MPFDRWKPTNKWTLAFRGFRAHHTEINHLYWAHHAAKKGAYSLTSGKDKAADSDSVFPDPKGERRRTITLEEWSDLYNEFDNWSRLSAVIAITGYLEVFLKTIVDAACQSCPAILIGGHRQIDGVSLLKSRSMYGFSKHAETCVKGTWQSRIRAYKAIFGSCPQVLIDKVSSLDKLRNLRNSVGHAFGRKLGPTEIGRLLGRSPAVRVSQKALQNHLGLVDEVAEAVETHLATEYVGSYEVLAAFHFWNGRGSGDGEERRQFRKHFNRQEDVSIKQVYFDDMIRYYRSA